jgi:fructokinase
VAGEVLIDLIPQGDDRIAIVGGGPANTAKALAKLDFDTYFIDGISTDAYGQKARAELIADGVKLDYSLTSESPTCVATVTLDSAGSASYEFLLNGTATFQFDSSWLPQSNTPPAVLHIGTLASIVEPGATNLFNWAKTVKAPLVFDPNIRSSVVSDRKRYQEIVRKWATIASVIKMSEDDLAWLYPDVDFRGVAEDFLNEKTQLVVLTKGADGLDGFTEDGEVTVPGVKVEVIDTVGAGDTVGAILVEGIVNHGLDNLVGDTLEKVLTRAAVAASIICSRAGANPPSVEELEGY